MQALLLNLTTATQRLENFQTVYPESLPTPQLWSAKTPEELTIPDWWGQSPEMWSNAVNFIDMFTFATDQTEPTIIFEDDTGFSPAFAEDYTAFLEEVPQDWDLLNLCARHCNLSMYPPIQVSNNVLRCKFTTHTNAIIVKPQTAARLAEYLSEPNWACNHVPDNRVAILCLTELKAYAPLNNICCQRAEESMLCPGLTRPTDNWFEQFMYIDLNGITVKSPKWILNEVEA